MPELDIPALLQELVGAEVEFLIIGGVAVGCHGYVRATKDVDVVPATNPGNLERLAKALGRLGAEVEGAADCKAGELPDPLDPDELMAGGNWVLSTRLGRLDVMQFIGDEALWDTLAANAVADEIAGVPLRIVAYDDLIALKERAGRPEDLNDLQRLREARQG